MKTDKTLWRILIPQLALLSVFFLLTVATDMVDVPHYLLGDAPTSYSQRVGEIVTETLAYVLVIALEFAIINKLRKRIRILEGFIPICANCKKIRDQKEWKAVEQYIQEYSLAQFSHSLCPQCLQDLYPDVAKKLQTKE